MRPALDAQPQADPRRALDPAPRRERRDRAQRPQRKRAHRGVAVFTINRTAFVIQQLADPTVPHKIVERELAPAPGFARIATSGYYSAYARC